ncbi:MAG: hypothetical protein QOJ56_4993 [Mycobacterium sp.]|jgi:hypothetical protein|nr:hypothetical protein [Mycobacterium sp.]
MAAQVAQLWDTDEVDTWADVVGSSRIDPEWPKAYNNCIMTECPACHARVLSICTNSVTGMPRRVPCLARVQNTT